LGQARALAVVICQKRGSVTADDVRAILPIPLGVHPNVMGAVFNSPLFECIGWQRSEQPQRHANRIAVWRLRNGARE
jgi:hypothetical protein